MIFYVYTLLTDTLNVSEKCKEKCEMCNATKQILFISKEYCIILINLILKLNKLLLFN